MLTKNFDKAFKALMTQYDSFTDRMVCCTGEIATSILPPFRHMNKYNFGRTTDVGVGLSGDDVFVGENSTSLPGILWDVTSKTNFPSNVSFSDTENYYQWSVSFEITAKKDITIKSLFLTGGASSGIPEAYLVDHTILDSPVTLKTGETKAFTYVIRFNKK